MTQQVGENQLWELDVGGSNPSTPTTTISDSYAGPRKSGCGYSSGYSKRCRWAEAGGRPALPRVRRRWRAHRERASRGGCDVHAMRLAVREPAARRARALRRVLATVRRLQRAYLRAAAPMAQLRATLRFRPHAFAEVAAAVLGSGVLGLEARSRRHNTLVSARPFYICAFTPRATSRSLRASPRVRKHHAASPSFRAHPKADRESAQT